MSHLFRTTTIILSSIFFLCSSANAEMNANIKELQQEWAVIKYQLGQKEQEAALEKLSLKAASVRETQPENADAYLWEGIILSTYAGAIGTLRALKAVTQSKEALEKSLALDPAASNGAANTYLGTLYYLVPEWPIAFGDLELAEEYLDKAIALNPDDIDVNFFHADFLKKLKKYSAAEAAYKRAISAPGRPGREIADTGRRKEAKKRMEKMLAKIK